MKAKAAPLIISAESGHFLRLTENLANFGFGELPDKVHFSFATGTSTSLFNFHVTKEISDRENKPQIRIFEMKKTAIKPLLRRIAAVQFEHLYERLTVSYQQNLSRKDFYNRVAFLSFDDISCIPQIWDIKKNKLRLTAGHLSALESWTKNANVKSKLSKQFYSLPWRPARTIQNGFLISPAVTGVVFIFNGQYFRQRENVNLVSIFKDVLGDFTALRLIVKTRFALRDIQTATDKTDGRKYSHPILLSLPNAES